MHTLRQAADTLSHAAAPDGLTALAAWLGFHGSPLAVDAATRDALGIGPEVDQLRLLHGRGALRAMLVTIPAGISARALFSDVAAALATRTTNVLWVIVAATAGGDEAGIACWSADARPPHVAALVVRPAAVVASDAEALCALEAASAGDDLLVHASWCDLLGRGALSRRFYRVLEQRVAALARSLPRMPERDRADLALLATSRLLFLSFLQAKGWLDGDRAFLASRFDECMASGGEFHQRVLLPLFFGTLNTPIHRRAPAARRFGAVPFLNGGLFTRTPLERRHADARFSDETLGELFSQLLGAYRFTAREEQGRWSEVAIDPEMLGRAFESLMASRERRASGAYYTPQALVAHVADQALISALAEAPLSREPLHRALNGGSLDESAASVLRERLRGFTVLDPASGSGAFLVYLLERITLLHRAAGDGRAVATIRRDVLAQAIHGVDVNPTAVWLCELRLWLSVVIESNEMQMSAVCPLPNLDCNVRVGDSLAGDGFVEPPALVGPSAALVRLRDRYLRAAGPRKAPLRRAIARDEARRALAAIDRQLLAIAAARRERLRERRSPDLFGEYDRSAGASASDGRLLRERAAALRRERRRIADGGALPFSFPSHFAHAHARGGFQLVIGNPPWVRLHNIPPATRAALRLRFEVFRHAAWEPRQCGAPERAFGAQVDLASLFVERSIALAAPARSAGDGGTIALLLPAKLWRSLSGGGVRRLLGATAHLRRVEDWTDAPGTFDAAVYPSIVVATRSVSDAGELTLSVRRRSTEIEWRDGRRAIGLDPADDASPWLLLPPAARAAFERVRASGTPLGASRLGRPMLGVKCGCNDAYLVECTGGDDVMATVARRGRAGRVERALLRPLLRGESLTRWTVRRSPQAIVWTHTPADAPLVALPAEAARWLAPWRRRLRARVDLHGSPVWWMLFRTEGADHRHTRVVWGDFGRAPRAAILAAGDPTVPLNSCYLLSCGDPLDALALAALLNGPLAAAWLNAIAEPARGQWHRYLAWTVAFLPLPRDWSRARVILAPLAERALRGTAPTDDELLIAACDAYRLRYDDVAALVTWCG